MHSVSPSSRLHTESTVSVDVFVLVVSCTIEWFNFNILLFNTKPTKILIHEQQYTFRSCMTHIYVHNFLVSRVETTCKMLRGVTSIAENASNKPFTKRGMRVSKVLFIVLF